MLWMYLFTKNLYPLLLEGVGTLYPKHATDKASDTRSNPRLLAAVSEKNARECRTSPKRRESSLGVEPSIRLKTQGHLPSSLHF